MKVLWFLPARPSSPHRAARPNALQVVPYDDVSAGKLSLLESITESPFTWCVPHAWLEFALTELQAGVTVVQVGSATRAARALGL